jgi:hypothetical protein
MALLPNESDTLKKDALSLDNIEVETEDDGVAIEVIDDTPPEDRNRKPLQEDPEPSEDEMAEYSEAVKRRISKMKHGLHDERRAKEAAARERDEAISVANRILAEKKALESRFAQGETVFLAKTKETADMSMVNAKRMYKEAYELGDADKMADAQELMANIAMEKKQTEEWSRQAVARQQESTRQEEQRVVQSAQSSRNQASEPDQDATAWAAKNKWFGQNKEMTAFAYGVHDTLVEDGIDPKLDASEYYSRLNKRVREVFPDYEWKDAAPKNQTRSVVAPVNRTTKTTTRVRLTQSQLSVAKRMGITPQQYALEVAKLEN